VLRCGQLAKFKSGDKVRIRTRPVTAEEVEERSFMPHYCGLVGEVARTYDGGEVAVRVDPEHLSDDITRMHKQMEKRVKEKFLTGLSEEGRRRLSAEEKEINLSYVVIVKQADLEPVRGKRSRKAEPESEAPHRPTETDLERAEEAYLKARKKK
jgi:ribosomal protein L21E